MTDASSFYKANTHYCAECVGRKDSHTDACSVPAKEAKLAKQAAKEARPKSKSAKNEVN